MKTVRVKSIEETNALANKVATLLEGDGLLCMAGDLGAGKTTFTKALGKALGIDDVITSPTFNILKIYDGEPMLYHIDAYRLEGIQQDLGFEEVFDENGIKVVEWYDYINDVLPSERLEIHIALDGEDRLFQVSGIGKKYQEIEEVL
ncbi:MULTISPECIES: tRNA (adenosine(37)-N6)-threonylcarbamoyltransferase complex ATPase subunit type 1 TsaE [unclassified Breznakia]|uniref:tRNA (adenosine(37)-N6)-threonylcarbamoyltransferase complex ATPase subunit type 1 TsaE n=1 Tax=unclassified Breznakia TaxID=2623764 RepID=UPI002473686B|nr:MULTISPECIES: tRNA (adenosine(37)-N6)-threonylcarbamoyltransferase complex ATPase subunit type 1 TsaE [unclassified Breznakia]MDH6367670.1 tRNA threonylcarbamoyladenosine biosynthesis protein TsaE [Breznakia sp. PH1-1]MDH6404737.1 tRNA threonylcarbamoyladenosine biosynthesis protein TsaE [Breznakia sp. PF1-11]MDH6412452.1 tRNA threonylcarbamoyladenosine biosynthesis protein TsaE [Breznakia sp. PFB1-11]MDH6414812.1 tRNA threonylcarbamoyladenosine biosynthesis protein TsaE [Breznakia sp. PFB1-